MWPLLPASLPGLIVVIGLACVAMRFVVPVALRALIEPLREVVGVLAALLVLPEFWISTARRRDGGTPPYLAYVYGNGVGRLATLGHQGVGTALRSLARAATTVHPLVVGIIAAAWHVAVHVG